MYDFPTCGSEFWVVRTSFLPCYFISVRTVMSILVTPEIFSCTFFFFELDHFNSTWYSNFTFWLCSQMKYGLCIAPLRVQLLKAISSFFIVLYLISEAFVVRKTSLRKSCHVFCTLYISQTCKHQFKKVMRETHLKKLSFVLKNAALWGCQPKYMYYNISGHTSQTEFVNNTFLITFIYCDCCPTRA